MAEQRAKKWHLSTIAKQHHREAALKAHARLHYQVGERNSRYGTHWSKETREKIVNALKQRYKNNPDLKPTGSRNPMFGRKWTPEEIEKFASKIRGRHYHTEEHKKELSERFRLFNPMNTPEARKKRSEKYKGLFIGEKNPNWRGGTSFEPYCIKFNKEFKERCRAFFNYICIECGTPENGRKHAIHHVNYNKMVCCNSTKPLFVCLCSSCNAKANSNRNYWEQHYTEMIENYYQGKCYLSKEEMKRYSSIL